MNPFPRNLSDGRNTNERALSFPEEDDLFQDADEPEDEVAYEDEVEEDDFVDALDEQEDDQDQEDNIPLDNTSWFPNANNVARWVKRNMTHPPQVMNMMKDLQRVHAAERRGLLDLDRYGMALSMNIDNAIKEWQKEIQPHMQSLRRTLAHSMEEDWPDILDNWMRQAISRSESLRKHELISSRIMAEPQVAEAIAKLGDCLDHMYSTYEVLRSDVRETIATAELAIRHLTPLRHDVRYGEDVIKVLNKVETKATETRDALSKYNQFLLFDCVDPDDGEDSLRWLQSLTDNLRRALMEAKQLIELIPSRPSDSFRPSRRRGTGAQKMG